jgi:hypothetical protein
VEGVRATAVAGDEARAVDAVVVSWCAEHLNLLRRLEDPISQATVRIAQD